MNIPKCCFFLNQVYYSGLFELLIKNDNYIVIAPC